MTAMSLNAKKSLSYTLSRAAGVAVMALASAASTAQAQAPTHSLAVGESGSYAAIKQKLDADGQVLVAFSGRVGGELNKKGYHFTTSRDKKIGYVLHVDNPKDPTKAEVHLALSNIMFGNPNADRTDKPAIELVSEGFRTSRWTRADAEAECADRLRTRSLPECGFANDYINHYATRLQLPFMRGTAPVQLPNRQPEGMLVTISTVAGVAIVYSDNSEGSFMMTFAKAASVIDRSNTPVDLIITNEGNRFIPSIDIDLISRNKPKQVLR